MGILICNNHGQSGILQLSEDLLSIYKKRTKTDIILLAFKYPGIPELHYYFSYSEEVDWLLHFETYEDFDMKLSKISGNPVVCYKCFFEYLDQQKIKIQKKIVYIPEQKEV